MTLQELEAQREALLAALSAPDSITFGDRSMRHRSPEQKGGEANAIFLFPDLSQAGEGSYQRFGPTRDAVIRLFYVGLTRARQALYLCQRESAMAVHL